MTSPGKKETQNDTDDAEKKEESAIIRANRRPNWLTKINAWDVLLAVAFLLLGAALLLARLQQNYPNVILDSDAANIASFALVQGHPELFTGDLVLSNPSQFANYATIHLPLTRVLNRLAGNFGLAFVLPLGATVFLQLLGFYILGRVLLRSRLWALLFTLAAAAPLRMNVGEFWGLWSDPLPRFAFQAVLPYLLSLAVVWRDQPRRWPVVMILAGLMVFLHPVSAPTWGFAIWLGLWLCHPAEWSPRKRLLVMLGLGGLFLLALAPFGLNYLAYQPKGRPENYAEVMNILLTIYPERLGDTLVKFSQLLWSEGLVIGLAGLGLTIYLTHKAGAVKEELPSPKRGGAGRRGLPLLVLAWMAGLLLIAVGLTAVERAVEAALQILPLQTELIRALRYTIPLLLLFCLWPLTLLAGRTQNQGGRWLIRLAGILLVTGWLAAHPLTHKLPLVADCLQQGALVCSPNRQVDEVLSVLQQTPRGTAVLAYCQDPAHEALMMSTRYLAMRPLVFTSSDIFFNYTNAERLERWKSINAEFKRIRTLDNADRRLDALLALARSTGAGVIWTDFDVNESYLATLPLERLYLSQQFVVVRVK